MTHGFVMEFKDETDRDYFLNTDPSHKAFVEAIIPQNSDFLVLDFTVSVVFREGKLWQSFLTVGQCVPLIRRTMWVLY
jgi:hypothetical protein